MMEKVLSQSWVQTTPEADAKPPVPGSLAQEDHPKATRTRQKEEKSTFIVLKNTKIGVNKKLILVFGRKKRKWLPYSLGKRGRAPSFMRLREWESHSNFGGGNDGKLTLNE